MLTQAIFSQFAAMVLLIVVAGAAWYCIMASYADFFDSHHIEISRLSAVISLLKSIRIAMYYGRNDNPYER